MDYNVYTLSDEFASYSPVQDISADAFQNPEFEGGTIMIVNDIPELSAPSCPSVPIQENAIHYTFVEPKQHEYTLLNVHAIEVSAINYVFVPNAALQANVEYELLDPRCANEIVPNVVFEEIVCNNENIEPDNSAHDQSSVEIDENSNYVDDENYTDNYEQEFQNVVDFNEHNDDVMDVSNSYDVVVDNGTSNDGFVVDEMLNDINDDDTNAGAGAQHRGVADSLISAQFENDLLDDNPIIGADIIFHYKIEQSLDNTQSEKYISVNKSDEMANAYNSNYTTQEIADQIDHSSFEVNEVLDLDLNSFDAPGRSSDWQYSPSVNDDNNDLTENVPNENQDENALIIEYIREKTRMFQNIDDAELQNRPQPDSLEYKIPNGYDQHIQVNRFDCQFENSYHHFFGSYGLRDRGDLSQKSAGALLPIETIHNYHGEFINKCAVEYLPYNENEVLENIGSDEPSLVGDFAHPIDEDDCEMNEVEDVLTEHNWLQNVIHNLNAATPHDVERLNLEPDLFNCDICEYSTGCERDIAWHTLWHAVNVPCRCLKCNIAAPDLIFSRLQRLVRARRTYRCSICRFVADSVTRLGEHMRAHDESANRHVRKRA